MQVKNIFCNTLLALTVVTGSILPFIQKADARPWKREIYRISDLNEADVIDGCRKKFGTIQDATRQGDRITCLVIRQTGNTRIGYDIRLDGTVIINNKRSGTVSASSGGQVFSQDNTRLEVNKFLMSTNESCDRKWPRDGTWAGDGGTACYDSWQRWIGWW